MNWAFGPETFRKPRKVSSWGNAWLGTSSPNRWHNRTHLKWALPVPKAVRRKRGPRQAREVARHQSKHRPKLKAKKLLKSLSWTLILNSIQQGMEASKVQRPHQLALNPYHLFQSEMPRRRRRLRRLITRNPPTERSRRRMGRGVLCHQRAAQCLLVQKLARSYLRKSEWTFF